MKRFLALLCLLISLSPTIWAKDALPSWKAGPIKTAILTFVAATEQKGGPQFVPVPERIAVFDNDGTLWSEQPLYVPNLFVFDRIRSIAAQHPEWAEEPTYNTVLDGRVDTLRKLSGKAFNTLYLASEQGVLPERYEAAVLDFLKSQRHPRFNRPYTELVYQPMLELMTYLRVHGFKTYIVTGGPRDFIRPWSEAIYGVPREQVIGTHLDAVYEVSDQGPRIVTGSTLTHSNVEKGKVIGIFEQIGRRPILAVGNSDGDYEMLDWTTAQARKTLALYIHHDDAEREWAYDKDSDVGRLKRGLEDAPAKGWRIVSMKQDWIQIFPFESGSR
jgi:phosphoserine phosphatase